MINETHGWRTNDAPNGVGLTMTKNGWRAVSDDGKSFRVHAPDGTLMCDDLGTAVEAQRFVDACLRREQK